jgi:uncharacterized protein involved in exopolysaccharide biosynthesis
VTTMNGDDPGIGSVGRLVSRWRWVLLAAVIVPVVIGFAFAVSAPPDYVSQAQLLIPASDPVTTRTTQVSAITIRLRSYAQSGLEESVRSALGSRASELDSVTGEQDRSEDVYTITAHSPDRALAQEAVAHAAHALFRRSDELAREQVAKLKGESVATIASLMDTLVALDAHNQRITAALNAAKQGPAPKPLLAARSRTVARVRAVTDRIDALRALLGQADQRYIERRSVSTLISPPSTPKSALAEHLVSTVGLALVVGVAAGILTILAMEAMSQRRRRRAVQRSNPSDPDLGPNAPESKEEMFTP